MAYLEHVAFFLNHSHNEVGNHPARYALVVFFGDRFWPLNLTSMFTVRFLILPTSYRGVYKSTMSSLLNDQFQSLSISIMGPGTHTRD